MMGLIICADENDVKSCKCFYDVLGVSGADTPCCAYQKRNPHQAVEQIERNTGKPGVKRMAEKRRMPPEQARRVKWILTDLDGTLLNAEKKITGRTLDALLACREKGIQLAFATGRNFITAGEYREILHPEGCVLAYGAQMFYGDRRFDYALSPEALLGIARRAEGCSRVDFWYRSGTSLEMKNPDLKTLEAAAAEAPETLSVACWGMPVECVKETENLLGVTATHYVRDIWCNFCTGGRNKESGAQQLLAAYGCAKGEALGFGDEDCDLGFFRVCGWGVAMGNADAATLEGADWVTGTCDADGIAEFLEEQILPFR